MDEIPEEHRKTLLTSVPLSSEQTMFWNLGFRSACIECKGLLSEVISQIDDPAIIKKINKYWEQIRTLEKSLDS